MTTLLSEYTLWESVFSKTSHNETFALFASWRGKTRNGDKQRYSRIKDLAESDAILALVISVYRNNHDNRHTSKDVKVCISRITHSFSFPN